mmetsp:Transcript_11308/g.41387  ORF Transcript_11308/g.41387 Transcript_11308/m.41387 type:complete len:362 (-) Transcript_11308:82-1167(-)
MRGLAAAFSRCCATGALSALAPARCATASQQEATAHARAALAAAVPSLGPVGGVPSAPSGARASTRAASAASRWSAAGGSRRGLSSINRVRPVPAPPVASPLPGVRKVVLVASGKGGVGKSTLAANLACALAGPLGLRVGLLDADIFGPSVPRMMRLDNDGLRPGTDQAGKMIPFENHGVKCMSMGFLMEKGAAAVWRGPMVLKAMEQLSRGVAWGDLDVLVVDMPPGTGDVQLSVSQRLPVSGVLMVGTPQDVAMLDVERGIRMFELVKLPVLGLVHNMAYFTCERCEHRHELFPSGRITREIQGKGIELLGSLPLEPSVARAAEDGTPTVVGSPSSASSHEYVAIARRLQQKLQDNNPN